MIHLSSELVALLPPDVDPFEAIMGLDGELFREMEGRRTLRVRLGDQRYFLKTHSGVGWKRILEDLIQLKRPVIGAANEWRAIQRLRSLGIATADLIGYGRRGWNPARRRSFVLMGALEDTLSLEDLFQGWDRRPRRPGPEVRFKRGLIGAVAEIARCLHENGINHRDFYLCHFLLDHAAAGGAASDKAPQLYLIDLHRMQMRHAPARRWVLKDLAGLYFSSLDAGLTRRDYYRFLRSYSHRPLRETLADTGFWRAVQRRALRLYRSHWGRAPRFEGM